MGLAGAGAADQDDVALVGQEGAAGETRTRPSLIGVPSKAKASRSLATGSLAVVSGSGSSGLAVGRSRP